jgi:hypothetical protein
MKKAAEQTAKIQPKPWRGKGISGFNYSRIMMADAEAQTDLIDGVIAALEAAVERYDKEKVA